MTDDYTPLSWGELDDLAATIVNRTGSLTRGETLALIEQARAGAPDAPVAPDLIAATDQLGAIIANVAEVCGAHYRDLLSKGIPPKVAGRMVADLYRATITNVGEGVEG